MTESKAKEKAIKWFRYNWSEIYTINSVDIIKKTIDIALQEQAKEIRYGLGAIGNTALSKRSNNKDYVQFRISMKKWYEFWEKYTGKEEGK